MEKNAANVSNDVLMIVKSIIDPIRVCDMGPTFSKKQKSMNFILKNELTTLIECIKETVNILTFLLSLNSK